VERVKRGERVILAVDLENEEGKGRLCEVNYVNGEDVNLWLYGILVAGR
jgi:hypothetical protein